MSLLLGRHLLVLLLIAASAGIALAGDSAGFLQVTGPCKLKFPRDLPPTQGYARNGGTMPVTEIETGRIRLPACFF